MGKVGLPVRRTCPLCNLVDLAALLSTPTNAKKKE